jgi:hypothetical protein
MSNCKFLNRKPNRSSIGKLYLVGTLIGNLRLIGTLKGNLHLRGTLIGNLVTNVQLKCVSCIPGNCETR